MLDKISAEFKNLVSEYKKNNSPQNSLENFEHTSPTQKEFEQKNSELKNLFKFESNKNVEIQRQNQRISRMIPVLICAGLISTVYFSSLKHNNAYKANQNSQLNAYANPFKVIYSEDNKAISKLLGLGTTDFSVQHIAFSHSFEKIKFRQDLNITFIQLKPEDAQKYFASKNITHFDDKTNVAIYSHKPLNSNLTLSSAVIVTDHVISAEEKQKITNAWNSNFPTDESLTKTEISTLSEGMVFNLHKDITLFTPSKTSASTTDNKSLNFNENHIPKANNSSVINKDATDKINQELNKVTQDTIQKMKETP